MLYVRKLTKRERGDGQIGLPHDLIKEEPWKSCAYVEVFFDKKHKFLSIVPYHDEV